MRSDAHTNAQVDIEGAGQRSPSGSGAEEDTTTLDPQSSRDPLRPHRNDGDDDTREDGTHKSRGEDAYIVDWAPDDSEHPRNWPRRKKWIMVAWACLMELGISFNSSAYSSGSQQIQEEFGVSQPVATLGLTTFVAGLGVGALVLAPMSENFGRNSTYYTSFFIFAIFQLPVALAHNIGTILVCRFIAGFAGSVPLTVTGGTVGDVFAKDDSGFAVALFALAGTAGPALGPVASGWIALRKGWRWIFWVNLIVWMAVWAGTLLTLRETKADILIQRRAQRKRKETGDSRYHARIEKERPGYAEIFFAGITKPFKLLFTEAIVIAMATYNGYVYALLYTYFEAFPLVFRDRHGFNEGELGLAYLPIIAGTLLAFGGHHWQNRLYLGRKAANGGKPVPEARLAWALIGGPIFALSLFWFAFTTYRSVHWAAPLFSGVPFGLGTMIIYMAAVSFVTDSYTTDGASALAAVSLVRSLMGAGFPAFATAMYENLGYQYAGLLVALLAVVMSFMAPVFYVWGPSIRARSPHARHLAQTEQS
ncbi:unnamed protein product [Parajaminaea phylloscopi]